MSACPRGSWTSLGCPLGEKESRTGVPEIVGQHVSSYRMHETLDP